MGRPKKILTEDLVEVNGRTINCILTRKQRLALLAESIRSGSIKDGDLVKAIQAYNDMSADDPSATKFTLRIENVD